MPRRPPKSIRKFIRIQKASIRRQVLDITKQKEEINKLYKNLKQGSYNEKNKDKKVEPTNAKLKSKSAK